MGMLAYKVTTKPVATLDNRPVYKATFAFKPWTGWRDGDRQANAVMEFQSGVCRLRSLWRRRPTEECKNVLVTTDGQTVYEIAHMDGLLYDDVDFDTKPYKTNANLKGFK